MTFFCFVEYLYLHFFFLCTPDVSHNVASYFYGYGPNVRACLEDKLV